MLVKAIVPSPFTTLPVSAALIVQVFALSLPVSVFTPVRPPSSVPLRLPVPLTVNVSTPVPPVSDWIFWNVVVPAVVVMLPALAPVIAHVASPTDWMTLV